MERKFKKGLAEDTNQKTIVSSGYADTEKITVKNKISVLTKDEDIHRVILVLEQCVQDRTSQLEAANKELEAFSYSISHDLRAPLRHINGMADIMKREFSGQIPDEALLYLDKIESSVHKMESLIVDLLSFSQNSSIKFKKSIVKMSEVVEDALAQIKPFTMERIIDWHIASLPETYGNYNLLQQVWINLLENAVKYTRHRQKAVITIDYRREQNELVFYIQDNGVGFNMKYAEKLFGVFQRMHLPEQFEGTGLGLANVRRIIARHGGRTWAEAEVGRGARIYFTLPDQSDLN